MIEDIRENKNEEGLTNEGLLDPFYYLNYLKKIFEIEYFKLQNLKIIDSLY